MVLALTFFFSLLSLFVGLLVIGSLRRILIDLHTISQNVSGMMLTRPLENITLSIAAKLLEREVIKDIQAEREAH